MSNIKKQKQRRKPRIAWTDAEIAMLGTVPDQHIADLKGIQNNTVLKKRKELGIAPFLEKRPYSENELKLLGTDTDAAIARKTGRSVIAILRARTRLNLPAFKDLDQKVNRNSAIHFEPFKTLSQPDFYNEICIIYKEKTGEKLTYPKLSSMCFWSVSRLQKWFTPGTAQEPLQIPVRHHIWFTIISS